MKQTAKASGYSEFSNSQALQPCLVTRDLLRHIENQLGLVESELFADATGVERLYEISVVDEFGTETFYAAGHIPLNGFPETTEAVRILFEVNVSKGKSASLSERSFKVQLFFRSNGSGNRIFIRLRGLLAREKAVGLPPRVTVVAASIGRKLWDTKGNAQGDMRASTSVRDPAGVISDRVGWYNTRRPHQALGMKTPAEAYALAA